jgi:hypothetical protein
MDDEEEKRMKWFKRRKVEMRRNVGSKRFIREVKEYGIGKFMSI